MSPVPRLSVVCFTNDPPARVAAALALLRPVAAEIVVAVDDRVDPDTLGPLSDLCDRVLRAEFVAPLEANLAWLHDQATADWVLRVDGDDVASQALVDRLAAPGWDQGITHAYVSYRWLWDRPDQILDQPPWWPDPALRLIRNTPGIARFPHGAHRPPQVAGDHRFLDEALYHLDLIQADEATREAKADRYERDATGLRTDPGWSVNTTYYLPERLTPRPTTSSLPEVDAAAVRRVLSATDAAPLPSVSETPVPHVSAADRRGPAPSPGDVGLRVMAAVPVAVVGGRTYTFTIGVTNRSEHLWRPDRDGAQQVGGVVRDSAGGVVGGELRAPLPGPVAAGDEILVRLAVPQFPAPGSATLDIGLVDDDAGWHDTRLSVPITVQAGRRVLITTPASAELELGGDLTTSAVLGALTRRLPDVVPVLLAHPPGDMGHRFGCQAVASPWMGRTSGRRPGEHRGGQELQHWTTALLADAARLAAGNEPVDPVNGELLAPFADAAALLVAAGAAMSSIHGDSLLAPMALEVQIAEAFGLPVLVEGVHVGPIDRRRDRLAVLRIARVATRLTVRDAMSADALLSHGALDHPAPVVPDPATAVIFIAERDAGHDAQSLLATIGVAPGRPYVVFSLRAGRDGLAEVLTLRAIADAMPSGVATVYLPHSTHPACDDRGVVTDEWSRTHLGILGPDVDHQTAAAVIAGAELVAGTQFHLAVMARAAGVPVVGLAADPDNAMSLEAIVDQPGVRIVASSDTEGAGRAAAELLSEGSCPPGPRWDGDDLMDALASLLPPAPALA